VYIRIIFCVHYIYMCVCIYVYIYIYIYIYIQIYKLKFAVFSQKNTFFFLGSKNNLFKVALANYTFFPSFGQFVYTTPKKFLIFRSKPLIKPFSDVFVKIEVPLSERVTHRRKQVIVRRCQVW